MQYQVYKKVEEHYRFILKLASADIREASGKIKKTYWSEDELMRIRQEVEERLAELRDLEKGFSTEVEFNSSEDSEKATRYISRMDEELNAYRDSFLQLLEIWQQAKMPDKKNHGAIESIEKLVTSIEIFLDILISYEPLTPADFVDNLAPKLIYLEFSGVIDAIRKSLKRKLNGGYVTNVRIAETLTLLLDENQVTIEKLLPGLSHLTATNPHPVFTDQMITTAITNLEKDGFDGSRLKAVVQKMNLKI